MMWVSYTRHDVEAAAAEEEEEDDDDEAPPDARELDLWLLESQVPGCTRATAAYAYDLVDEDVARALPRADDLCRLLAELRPSDPLDRLSRAQQQRVLEAPSGEEAERELQTQLLDPGAAPVQRKRLRERERVQREWEREWAARHNFPLPLLFLFHSP